MSESIATETAQLCGALKTQRQMFLRTTQGLTDDQARSRSTVSELSIGGLVKHLTAMEYQWAGFAFPQPADGAGSPDWAGDDADLAAAHTDWAAQFRMEPTESLAELISAWQVAADATDAALLACPDLDVAYPLPAAPWFEPGATWSVRQTMFHLLVEIAQHSGHADIIREGIDGSKSMG